MLITKHFSSQRNSEQIFSIQFLKVMVDLFVSHFQNLKILGVLFARGLLLRIGITGL
jgi:hypothetical protein